MDSIHRQRVCLLLILEVFGLEIPAFGPIVANSAEIRESLLADLAFQKCPFSLRVKVRFFAGSFSEV